VFASRIAIVADRPQIRNNAAYSGWRGVTGPRKTVLRLVVKTHGEGIGRVRWSGQKRRAANVGRIVQRILVGADDGSGRLLHDWAIGPDLNREGIGDRGSVADIRQR